SRMGADITTEPTRRFINRFVNYAVQKIFRLEFRDAQCGVKIMTTDVVELAFANRFYTKTLFDIEILLRLKKNYGRYNVQQLWNEQPLDRWIYARKAKMSFFHSFNLLGQLGKISLHYK